MQDDLSTIQILEELRATPQIWERIPAGDSHSPSAQAALRREFSPDLVRAALTLATLRRQAAARFTRADRMWFDRTRLEQATQELVARHKARRFARVAGQPVLDLCCGIGADAIAIADSCPVTAVDSSPLAAWMTRQNADVYGVADRIETTVSSVEEISIQNQIVHLDPDRRTQGQRQVRLEFGSPPLEYLQQLTQSAAGGAIKVSPASNFGGKFPTSEIELVSVHGECKEATIWFGALRETAPFRATVLPDEVSIAGDPWEYRPKLSPLGRYLFDPDPAVVRAGLVDCLAESLGLNRLDDAEEYLTGDTNLESPFLRSFEVMSDLPNNPTEIRDCFRRSSFGQVEIKCRHIRIDADAVRRKLPLPGQDPGVLLFAKVAGKARAIVARRIERL